MNADQAERFQELLEEACDHYIEYDGGRIISGNFGNVGDKTQCPLRSLFGMINVNDMVGEVNSLLDTHTITESELWAFIDAFDDRPIDEYRRGFVSAILIGRALRAKYIHI